MNADRIKKLEEAVKLMRLLMEYLGPSREDFADDEAPAKTWDALEKLLKGL
jgi:hypothetical protein